MNVSPAIAHELRELQRAPFEAFMRGEGAFLLSSETRELLRARSGGYAHTRIDNLFTTWCAARGIP